MKKLKLLFPPITMLLTTLLLFSGCKKEEDFCFVRLNFGHEVAGNDLTLNGTWYNCAAGHKFQVTRLKYYASNFKLHKADGSTFDLQQVHYVDVEAPDTRSLMLKDVPKDEYTALSFIFGLDEAVNVDGGLPNTTTNINMEWPIPGDQGYHYMKFEGKYDSLGTGVIKSYNLHSGATGGNQNYVNINVPFHHAMNLNGGTWNVNLVMDMNEWLQNPHLYDFSVFGPMIMANQTAQQVLKDNGADVFTVTSVEKE